MISINAVWIALFASFVLMFLASSIFGYSSTKAKDKEIFSFTRNFPCEMYRVNANGLSGLHRAFLFIFIACCFGPLCISISCLSQLGDFGVFSVAIASVCGLTGLCYGAVVLVEARFVRPHTTIATIFFALAFLFVAMSAVFSFVVFSKDQAAKTMQLITGILSSLLALFIVTAMVNPKLKDWARLESHKNEDGTVEFVRPKYFPLAYTEWAVLLAFVLGVVCFFIALLSI